MDLGAYQLQIFLSLFVVLGAAFVALVCDLLHGNNEQLRVLNTELKVRREEEQKRFDILLGDKNQTKAQEAPAPAVEVAAVMELRAERNGRPQRAAERKRAPAPEALAAMERGAQMAALPEAIRLHDREEAFEYVPAAQEVQQSPARVASAQYSSPAPVNQEVEQVVERLVEHAVETTFAKGMEVPTAPASAEHTSTPSSPAGSRDWSSLLNRRATSPATTRPTRAVGAPTRGDLLAAVVAATDSTAPTQPAAAPLPGGFQDGFVLSRLVEGRQPITGLVVSLGVVAQVKDTDKDNDVPPAVRALLESLLGPDDFATQSGNEEYLLIYPGLRGAAADRRLGEVRQQLADFQDHSSGQFSVQVNWGGSEAGSESIDEAIAFAEHMNESRRGRKVLSLESDTLTALPKAG